MVPVVGQYRNGTYMVGTVPYSTVPSFPYHRYPFVNQALAMSFLHFLFVDQCQLGSSQNVASS